MIPKHIKNENRTLMILKLLHICTIVSMLHTQTWIWILWQCWLKLLLTVDIMSIIEENHGGHFDSTLDIFRTHCTTCKHEECKFGSMLHTQSLILNAFNADTQVNAVFFYQYIYFLIIYYCVCLLYESRMMILLNITCKWTLYT